MLHKHKNKTEVESKCEMLSVALQFKTTTLNLDHETKAKTSGPWAGPLETGLGAAVTRDLGPEITSSVYCRKSWNLKLQQIPQPSLPANKHRHNSPVCADVMETADGLSHGHTAGTGTAGRDGKCTRGSYFS